MKRHTRNVHGIVDGETASEGVGGGVGGEIEPMEDIKPDPDAPNNNFICDICNKNMQSGYNLKRHKVAVHKDTRV